MTGMAAHLPYAVAKRIVPLLPRRAQRFQPTSSWEAASRLTVGYEGSRRETATAPVGAPSPSPPSSTRDLQLLACLATAMNVGGVQSTARVVDLGGYHGHHHAVASTSLPRTTFDWTVVELPDVVESCADIATSRLHFTTDLPAALGSGADICVASASLNYLADPMGALTAMARAARAVVLLRLPLWPIAEHRPAIQRLSRHSAEAGYPTWFFSETQFRDQVAGMGRIILSFDVPEDRAYFAEPLRVLPRTGHRTRSARGMTTGPVRNYCTYFDHRYLPRGRAMIRSLREVGETAQVVVLALDARTAEGVADLDGVVVVTVSELEAAYPALSTVKGTRSEMEFVFTLTPWLTLHAMSLVPAGAWTTYLDADLFFFSAVQPVYDEMSNASVAIIPHRFPRLQQWRLKYGTYNVGWVSFRRDDEGLTCLTWWADRCLEWCYDTPSEGRFADQGYLDRFEEITSALAIIGHPGADLAPWNLAGHRVTRSQDGRSLIDGFPLVFFHFHGVTVNEGRYYFKHLPYLATTTPSVRESIYRPYCEALREQERSMAGLGAQQPRARRASLARSFQSRRPALLRLLARVRGDYLDL